MMDIIKQVPDWYWNLLLLGALANLSIAAVYVLVWWILKK